MPAIRSRWYSGERRPAEFSQDRERPEARLASGPSVTSTTRAPARANERAVETPRIPPPTTATSGGWSRATGSALLVGHPLPDVRPVNARVVPRDVDPGPVAGELVAVPGDGVVEAEQR